jgi:DNA-binding response OmpR family regulator
MTDAASLRGHPQARAAVRLAPAALVWQGPLAAAEVEMFLSLGIEARRFETGDELLVRSDAYEHGLFVIGGQASMPEALRLLRLLHRRTRAPILVWQGRAPCAAWLNAGADMWLPRSANLHDLAAAILALERRIAAPSAADSAAPVDRPWRLQADARLLCTPDGHRIALTETDTLVLECLASHQGAVVSYGDLAAWLGHDAPDADNWLRATLYRLRRRIEQDTGAASPIDAQARKGYVFRGHLERDPE